MKIINKLLYLGLLVGTLFACTPEEDDIFGNSSANRIDEAIKKTSDLLVGSTNGWLMEYYPSATQQYGGYTMLLSFTEDGMTTLAGSLKGVSKKDISTYVLGQSAGVVLTFDTYNTVMHYYSDPKNPSGIGINGKGMEGDLEFLIMEATSEKITLQGRKTRNQIVMTPLDASVNWDNYIQNIQEAEETMKFSNYEYHVNGKVISVNSTAYNVLNFVLETGEIITVPYVQTPTGYKFYTPLEIEDVIVEEVKYQQSGEDIEFIPTNGASSKLIAVALPLNQQMINGD